MSTSGGVAIASGRRNRMPRSPTDTGGCSQYCDVNSTVADKAANNAAANQACSTARSASTGRANATNASAAHNTTTTIAIVVSAGRFDIHSATASAKAIPASPSPSTGCTSAPSGVSTRAEFPAEIVSLLLVTIAPEPTTSNAHTATKIANRFSIVRPLRNFPSSPYPHAPDCGNEKRTAHDTRRKEPECWPPARHLDRSYPSNPNRTAPAGRCAKALENGPSASAADG